MAGAPTSQWKVLVVDDEHILLRMFERILSKDGHQVTTAATGTEALAKIRSETFDLFLLDKNLPPPDGVELAAAARKHSPSAGIVLLTGYASRDSADKLVGVADEYVSKPFEVEQVKALLNSVMERRRAKAPAPSASSSPSGVTRPPPATPTRKKDKYVVQLVLETQQEADRIGARAKLLGCEVSTDTNISRVRPDVLVIASSALAHDVRKAIWARQAEDPDFRVLLVTTTESLAESIAAVSVRAAGRMSFPFEDLVIDRLLKQATGL